MKRRITQAAVLGSGTMGSGIAASLANVGIKCFLLDIVPAELTSAELEKGLSLESPEVRNRISESNKTRFIKKARPAALMDKAASDLIKTGNMEDNLDWLSVCDWIIEVVPERLEIKQAVLEKISPYIKPGTIVSTNTSGISINRIAEGLPPEIRKYWLGTHFFNPVRYMKLLEIIPGEETLPEIVDFISDFGEKVLGKGIVVCKDTPNFIANRIGAALGTNIIRLMLEKNLTVSEVDAITGTCIGRPKTATFALYDMVGLDIGVASATTVHDNVSDPGEKDNLTFPEFIYRMLDKKLLGLKTKSGFYTRKGKEKFMLDVDSLEYVPVKKADFESLKEAGSRKTLAGKLEVFFEGDDTAAGFVWEHMKRYFVDAASKLPEICDDICSVDRALKWGYNHDCGPFEVWRGLDLAKYVKRMETEGETIPAWVKEMLSLGFNDFYREENGELLYYSFIDKDYRPVREPEGKVSFSRLKAESRVVFETSTATLFDIGDGVLCLDMHTRTSAISEELLNDMARAQDEMEKNWAGMVITSSKGNFCVGADLSAILGYVADGKWSRIDDLIGYSQEIYMRNKYSYKPVVIAPFGMVLGGGCEITMHGSAVQAYGESYMGLVELGVGLVPAGGGVKEMTMRAMQRFENTEAFLFDSLSPYLQNIATAKVSSSAKEAAGLGYLKKSDEISFNRDLLVSDAKRKVLELAGKNYAPPIRRAFPAPGINGNAAASMYAMILRDSKMISDYDMELIKRLVFIMTGGGVSKGMMINEDYLLQLEREVFIELCKEPKTQQRMKHMLETGKPLRN